MSTDEVWATIHHERARLANLLTTLTDHQWDHPSLCAGWRVRDVAAHVISSSDYSTTAMLVAAVRAGGSFNKLVDRTAREQGSRPTMEILARYEKQATSRRRPPGTQLLDPLVDVLVHSQDIAIPLRLEHPMPPEPARLAAAFVYTRGFPFNARRRHPRIRFQATDTDFAVGNGETVEGPIHAILLTLTGRAAGPRLLAR